VCVFLRVCWRLWRVAECVHGVHVGLVSHWGWSHVCIGTLVVFGCWVWWSFVSVCVCRFFIGEVYVGVFGVRSTLLSVLYGGWCEELLCLVCACECGIRGAKWILMGVASVPVKVWVAVVWGAVFYDVAI